MSKSDDSGDTGTRDRLLDAAMHLFAQKGVASSTVGDIELAAGLAPRSGALYNYFDSKDALLIAGLERHLATVRDIERDLALRPLGDRRSEFTMLGHWLLHELEVERDITHILEREGDHVAEIRERMRTGISDRGYLIGADVIGRWRTDLNQAERQRLAVIAVGALINYKRSTWTFGRAPLDLDAEALVDSWVHVCIAIITADPPPAT
jgi:AcrR family transcriptional regulator